MSSPIATEQLALLLELPTSDTPLGNERPTEGSRAGANGMQIMSPDSIPGTAENVGKVVAEQVMATGGSRWPPVVVCPTLSLK